MQIKTQPKSQFSLKADYYSDWFLKLFPLPLLLSALVSANFFQHIQVDERIWMKALGPMTLFLLISIPIFHFNKKYLWLRIFQKCSIVIMVGFILGVSDYVMKALN